MRSDQKANIKNIRAYVGDQPNRGDSVSNERCCLVIFSEKNLQNKQGQSEKNKKLGERMNGFNHVCIIPLP